MSNYHTASLADADVFAIMGSIYAEVARYDTAIKSDNIDQASQAAERAQEIIHFSQGLTQINPAQKSEILRFNDVLSERVKHRELSMMDDYLLPFAVSARLRQAV